MIISLKVLGFKRDQIFKIEDPEHINLTKLLHYYFLFIEKDDPNKIVVKDDQKVEYLFYSKAEQGFLNPDLPLSQLMIANEDQLIIIPTNVKFHLNSFEQKRRLSNENTSEFY